MEFHEKLQQLRKQKGFTQEELAEVLFVSRAAVSKWESGRGYPNIDSLKAIAKFFDVSIDDLLSGENLLSIAQEDSRQAKMRLCDRVFGLLDCSIIMFFFLPFFGQKSNTGIQEVALLSLNEIAPYLKVAYCIVLIGMIASGVLTLALQNCHKPIWEKSKTKLSFVLNTVGVLLFIISSQPYAATFLFVLLAIKALMHVK